MNSDNFVVEETLKIVLKVNTSRSDLTPLRLTRSKEVFPIKYD